MCLIIDANFIHRVLGPANEDIATLQAAIFKQSVVIVHGGKLTTEYAQSAKLVRTLAALNRAGVVRRVDDALVDAATAEIEPHCVSDDAHIIGLARATGARILCSADHTLHQDFGNRLLIAGPRGKVYQGNQHAPLLRKTCGPQC
jgi:hypothetical protein